MKNYSTEADARILIDDLLLQAGWDPADKSQVLTEISIRDTEWAISEPVAPYGYKPSRKTQDGDEVPTGRADYVLMDRRGRPLAIVEAKRTAIEDDPVRLVFHAFKPVKSAEVEAVQRLVQELALPHAEYAFVHVADDHPFQIFDQTQNGTWAGRQVRKGVCAPPRGLMVKLSNRDALLCLKGSHELKQASDGHPAPLCLHLHRASSFTDLTYLVRQAFAFSCHSWRSFLPAPLPITILYSELVAYNLRLLSRVSGWSDDAIVGRIGRTRWFL